MPSGEATIVASTNPSTLPIANTDVAPAGNDSGNDNIATAAPTSTNDSSDDNSSGELANSNNSLHEIDNGFSVSYLFPTDWLDYLGLGVDAAERLYIELNYKEGEEKDFQRFVNTLYFVIDAVFASTPGAGGGGLAARGSHELAVAGWRATPNSVKLRIKEELAKRMGWSVAKAAQMINVFFSMSSGEGTGDSGNRDFSGDSELSAPLREPDPGVGGNGTASEFGDLTRLTRKEVDTFLRKHGATVKGPTPDGYVEYKFPDKSKVTIRPNGEVVRTPAPKYGSDGRNINRGLRLGKDGSLLRTRDQFGNEIPGTHNTGERVSY